MTRKATKYIYWLVLQANYSAYGWEDIEQIDKSEDSPYKTMRSLMKEHRIACPSARYRIINRRELRHVEIV